MSNFLPVPQAIPNDLFHKITGHSFKHLDWKIEGFNFFELPDGLIHVWDARTDYFFGSLPADSTREHGIAFQSAFNHGAEHGLRKGFHDAQWNITTALGFPHRSARLIGV